MNLLFLTTYEPSPHHVPPPPPIADRIACFAITCKQQSFLSELVRRGKKEYSEDPRLAYNYPTAKAIFI